MKKTGKIISTIALVVIIIATFAWLVTEATYWWEWLIKIPLFAVLWAIFRFVDDISKEDGKDGSNK